MYKKVSIDSIDSMDNIENNGYYDNGDYIGEKEIVVKDKDGDIDNEGPMFKSIISNGSTFKVDDEFKIEVDAEDNQFGISSVTLSYNYGGYNTGEDVIVQ